MVWFVVLGDAADTRDRVRTLTGKEIELDIEPDYKVRVFASSRLAITLAGIDRIYLLASGTGVATTHIIYTLPYCLIPHSATDCTHNS